MLKVQEPESALPTAELPIILCHFRTRRTLKSTHVYSLQFKQGTTSWVVERRYSEFLRCHVQLLEAFRRHELPRLPPKEPVLQKIFGRGGRAQRMVGGAERVVAPVCHGTAGESTGRAG